MVRAGSGTLCRRNQLNKASKVSIRRPPDPTREPASSGRFARQKLSPASETAKIIGVIWCVSHSSGLEHIATQLLSSVPEVAGRSRRLLEHLAPVRRGRRRRSVARPGSRTERSCCGQRRIDMRNSFPEHTDSSAKIWNRVQLATGLAPRARTIAGLLRTFLPLPSDMCDLTPIRYTLQESCLASTGCEALATTGKRIG
jgi:hypothetical protein